MSLTNNYTSRNVNIWAYLWGIPTKMNKVVDWSTLKRFYKGTKPSLSEVIYNELRYIYN